MARMTVTLRLVAFLHASSFGCGQERPASDEGSAAQPGPPAPEAAQNEPPGAAPAPSAAQAGSTPAQAVRTSTPAAATPAQGGMVLEQVVPVSAEAGGAEASTAAAGAAREVGPFEPSGNPLPLAGLTAMAEGGRPYQPLSLPWSALSALLDVTPGLRAREHVGFYPPRPIDLTGRPAPYTFGYANALSRAGHWRAAPDATFLIVPFHHDGASLAFYSPAGEGTVRFVTRVEPFVCEETTREIGFVVTRAGDKVQVLRTCGAQAEVVSYRAQNGKLAASIQTVTPGEIGAPTGEPAPEP